MKIDTIQIFFEELLEALLTVVDFKVNLDT